jgi:hypothetical protein
LNGKLELIISRIGVVGLLLLLAGCASPAPSHRRPELAVCLQSLNPTINEEEASSAAETAIVYSLELAREYRVVRPAIFHNVLVNIGLKKRGLCFQWADDLSAKLLALGLRTIEIRRATARLDTRREHSSVVLTAVGQPFREGVVLDAWRHSGRLYWCGVNEDTYPWKEVEVLADGEVRPKTSADRVK